MKKENKNILINFSVLLFFILNSYNNYSQLNNDTTGYNIKNIFLRKVIIPNDKTKSHLFYVSFDLNSSFKSESSPTSGFQFAFGFNFSRFFTHKIHLGIIYSRGGIFSSVNNIKFSNQFIDDFNQSFNSNQKNLTDSASAFTLKRAINNENDYGVSGNAFNVIGIAFSPFPDQYGGVTLNLFYGTNYVGFYGIQNIIPSPKSVSNLASLNQNNFLRTELVFKPYYISNSGKLHSYNGKIKNIYKLITAGFYFERTTLNNVTFDKKPLTQFVNQSFIDKYKLGYRFGFKIGFGLY